MRKILEKGIVFTRKNPTIIASLSLIVVMTGALFLNAYLNLQRHQAAMDKAMHSKALLVEKVFASLVREYFGDLTSNAGRLNEAISQIRRSDHEMLQIAVYAPRPDGNFDIVANDSALEETSEMSAQMEERINKMAWSLDEGFAMLGSSQGQRYWNVVYAVRNKENVPQGIVSLKLSLAQSDKLVTETIFRTYAFALASAFIVLVLVFNHMRFFRYEVKASRLEEIDKMKDDFISMASHELRGPLAAIRGYIDLLSGSIREKFAATGKIEDELHYLSNMDISVGRLGELVEDLLEVSRIEQNRLIVKMEPVDAEILIGEVVDEMKVLADQKMLELKNSVRDLPRVLADSARLKQVVVNLLGNAIKYTPAGNIELSARCEKNHVFITISDTGVGMSADQMKNLFGKFQRIQTAKTKKIPGTGLGLWISREIARKMEGDIEVESMEGVGSRFTVRLKTAGTVIKQ